MRRYRAFVAQASGLTLLLIALGAVPTYRLAGSGGVKALLAGCCTGFVASVISGLPAARVRVVPQNAVILALAATGIRLGVVVAVVVVLALASGLPRAPLLIWTGIGYLAMLPLETRFLLHSAAGNSGSEPLEIS